MPPLRALTLVVVLLMALPAAAVAQRAPAQVPTVLRIMPMGDSITVGESPDVPAAHWVGYRLPLYERLTGAGVRFDFVGSLEVGDERLPDRHVEARGGRTIEEIAGWARARTSIAHPAVVLLLAGTNDAAQGLSVGAGQRYRGLLQQIRLGVPDADVLAATIPPIGYAPWEIHRPTINDGIRWAVSRQAADGQRVTLVETPALALSSDTVHPSEAGYGALAELWTAALLDSQAVACAISPRVVVHVERGGPAQLRVTATSRAGPIQRVDLGPGAGVQLSADLTVDEQTASFTVVRSGSGAGIQPFTVTDRCGTWDTFVGGGPSAW